MKIALVHDYLTQKGGAERVFELLCQHFPEADIFTSLYDPQNTIELGDRRVQTTLLQNIPHAAKYFRLLAPFYYPAFRSLDLQRYDLIISSCSSFAKAVQKRPDAKHICFCHNVPRFLWDTKSYLREYKDFQAFLPILDQIFHRMKRADLIYAQEPDLYVANSSTVAQRIRTIYNKPVITVNYPVDAARFKFSHEKENYFLVMSRLLSYKRVDIIIEAFNQLGWPLVISGDGPERSRLQAKAKENITFLGQVSDAERCRLLTKAQAVIVAALEDYGLVPIEANISGTPVISYGAGGVLDTQIPGQTGLFFQHQTPDALQATLLESCRMKWNYDEIRDHALSHFTEKVFFDRVGTLIQELCEQRVPHLVS
ncbi:MAG: glycosyltransferase [Oculatellaceae cyanobacterium Prado106]|jgi:glycosyltransferase involved in cell wall biosynthesis|nr:glycosyltransferase [Oculatellaceae cyanobacterium Prado106]